MGLALSMAKAGSNRWMATRLEKKQQKTIILSHPQNNGFLIWVNFNI